MKEGLNYTLFAKSHGKSKSTILKGILETKEGIPIKVLRWLADLRSLGVHKARRIEPGVL